MREGLPSLFCKATFAPSPFSTYVPTKKKRTEPSEVILKGSCSVPCRGAPSFAPYDQAALYSQPKLTAKQNWDRCTHGHPPAVAQNSAKLIAEPLQQNQALSALVSVNNEVVFWKKPAPQTEQLLLEGVEFPASATTGTSRQSAKTGVRVSQGSGEEEN